MSTATMPRAAIYARYSTDKQDMSSIEDQVRVCTRLCEQKGFAVCGVYKDAAMSGTTLARPELSQLVADASASRFNVLVLESLSRLSRDSADLQVLYRELQFRDIRIVTVDYGDISPMHVGMQGTMSALSIQATSKETFRKHEGEVLRGQFMGGQGYGYRTIRAFGADGKVIKGKREIVLEEAVVIRRIFFEYAAGKSAKTIAADLNNEGIPGPRGGHWRHTAILGHRGRGTGILNNELYRGVYVWNRQQFRTRPVGLNEMAEETRRSGRPRVARPNDQSMHLRIEHPELAIVPQDLWDAVKARQVALDERVERQRADSGGKNRRAGIGAARRSLTVLAGRIFCGSCGGTVTASGGRYVRCSTAADTGGSICSHTRNHRRDRIEAEVFDGLGAVLGSPDTLKLFQEAYLKEIATANNGRAGQSRERGGRLERIDQEIRNLVDAIGRGFTNPSVKGKLDALEAERVEIQAESQLPAPDPIIPHPDAESLWWEKIQAVSATIKDGPDGHMIREALRGLVGRVDLRPDTGAASGFSVQVTGALADLLPS